MRKRSLIAAVLAVSALLFSAGVAHTAVADELKTVPRVVQHVGFESDADSLALYQIPPLNSADPTATAGSWGRISPRHLGGSYGLWCAGTDASDWPTYPVPTRGLAVMAVADTSGFQSSSIQYSYIEPGYGDLENINPFVVSWADASQLPTATGSATKYFDASIPLAPVWTTRTIRRDNTVGATYPPTTAGWLRFRFASNPYDVASAEGASIDDVIVSAYKFGQVGNLTVVRGTPHTSVTVSWTAAPTPSGTTPWYDVWRRDVTANGAWMQLNGVRINGLTYTDATADLAHAYEYVVQAWNGSTAADDYGQVDLAKATQLSPAGSTTLGATFAGSATSTTAPVGAKIAVTGTLRNIDNAALAGKAAQVVVQTSADGSTWTTAGPTVASAAVEQSSGSYLSTVTASAAGYVRMQFGGSGNYQLSDSPALRVTTRKAISSWGSPVVLNSPLKYNTALKLQAALGSEVGPVTGRSALVALLTSSDNSTWTTMTATVAENSAGVYTATSSRITEQNQYYRLAYVGETNYSSASSGSLKAAWTPSGVSYWTPNPPAISTTKIPYGGTFTIGGSPGSLDTGVAVTSQTVVCEDYYNAQLFQTVPCVEDTPGHYRATFAGVTSTNGHQYRLRFVASAQYNTTYYSSWTAVSPVAVQAAALNFANAQATPATPITGATTTLSVDVFSETGTAVGSASATVSLWSSTDRSTWTTVTPSVTDAPSGHFAVPVLGGPHIYYRFSLASKNANYTVTSAASTSSVIEVTSTPDPATSIGNTFASGSTAPVSILYGGSAKIVGTLRNAAGIALFGHASDVALQVSPDGSTGWTPVSVPAVSSTTESATAPGTYEISVIANYLGTKYFRMAYAGSGGLDPSQAPLALAVTAVQAKTWFSAQSFTPSAIQFGQSAVVGAALSAQTGPVAGRASGIKLQSSTQAATGFTDTGIQVVEDSRAHYSATIIPLSGARYYRLVFAGEVGLQPSTTTPTSLTVNAAATSWSGLPSSPQSYVYGGTSRLAGMLATTSPLPGRAVALQVKSGTGTWTTVPATIDENPDVSGYYTATFAPAGTGGSYRLWYQGETGKYQPAGSSEVVFASTSAATGWTTPEGVSQIAFGGDLALSAVLSTDTPVPAEPSKVKLRVSSDGIVWADTAATVSEAAGTYTATLKGMRTPGTLRYALRFTGDGTKYAESTSTAVVVTVGKQVTQWTNAQISTTAVWAGIGTVTIQGSLRGVVDGPLTGRKPVLQSSPATDGVAWVTAPATPIEVSPGNYAVTISSPTDSIDMLYRLSYGGSANDAPASWTANKLSVSQPTLSIETSTVSLTPATGYNGLTRLSARLVLGGKQTTDLRGGQVLLERTYNPDLGIVQSSVCTLDPTTGRFYASSPTPITTWYRLRYPKTDLMPESMSFWYVVSPKAYLSTPSTPSKPRHGRYFTMTGKVSRALRARYVVIRAEHLETKIIKRKRTKVWVARISTKVLVGAGSGIASYKISLKPKYTGSWRVRTSVADSYNAATTSAWRGFKAR